MVLHKVYMNQIHSSSLLRQLSELWKKKILCDAAVFTGSVEIIKAHRAVLLAASPKLQTMSKNIPIGSCLDVRLPAGVCQSAVKTFLSYLYEGTLTLTDNIVGDVMRIANLLQISSLQKCCEDFYMALERERRGITENDDKNSCTLNLETFDEFDHVRSSELCQIGDSFVDPDKPVKPAEIEQPALVGRKKRRKQEQPNPKMVTSRTQPSSSHIVMRKSLSPPTMVSFNNNKLKTSSSSLQQLNHSSYPVALIQNRSEDGHIMADGHVGITATTSASMSAMQTAFPTMPNYTVVKSEPDVGKVVDGILSQEDYGTSSHITNNNYLEAVSMSQEQYDQLQQQSSGVNNQQEWLDISSGGMHNIPFLSQGARKQMGNTDVSRFARAFKKTKNATSIGSKTNSNIFAKLPFTKVKMPKSSHVPLRGRPPKLSKMKVSKASHMCPHRGRPPKLSKDVLEFIDNLVKVEPYITLIGIQKKIKETFTGESKIISITTINRALRDHLKLFKRIPRNVSQSLYENATSYSETDQPEAPTADVGQNDDRLNVSQEAEENVVEELGDASEENVLQQGTSEMVEGSTDMYDTNLSEDNNDDPQSIN